MHAHGFKLRRPQPATSITVAAFGPAMTRVAAHHADEVVLNLVTPEHVAAVRAADRRTRPPRRGGPPRGSPSGSPAALYPGEAAQAQLAGQLAIYLGAPGYGELFAGLGFGRAGRARRAAAPPARGARRRDPARAAAQVGGLGSARRGRARGSRAYHDAGADHVGVVPSTAEDPAGRRVLDALSPKRRRREADRRPVDLTHRFQRRLRQPGARSDRRPLDADDPARGLFGVRRYGQFARNLGIPRPTCRLRLRSMVDSGLLERVPYAAIPTATSTA